MASSPVVSGSLRLVALALLVITTLLAPAAVRAEGPGGADKETARQLMDMGNHHYRQGKYDEALESYRGADSIMGVTSTGLGVGKALMQLGRLIEARDKLLDVSRIPALPDESSVLNRAREEADTLQRELADWIPALRILVVGVPDDAQVVIRLDGIEVPRERLVLPRRVNPGTHTILATCPGYHDVDLEITVAQGKTRTVELAMTPGSGKAPDTQDTASESVSPLVWIGFGIAGLGVTVGAITGGLSLAAAADAKDQCVDTTCPVDAEPDADRSLALAHTSTVSFVVAGLGAGLGVLGLVLGGSEDTSDSAAEPAPTVEALIGPGSLGLRGRF